MYRQYENVNDLKEQLEHAKNAYLEVYQQALHEGMFSPLWESLSDVHGEIEDLEERINFAIQDMEYDEEVAG